MMVKQHDAPRSLPSYRGRSNFAHVLLALSIIAGLLIASSRIASAQEKKVDSFTISYASMSGTRAPLWTTRLEAYPVDPVGDAAGRSMRNLIAVAALMLGVACDSSEMTLVDGGTDAGPGGGGGARGRLGWA
jgi:hypothetical protein